LRLILNLDDIIDRIKDSVALPYFKPGKTFVTQGNIEDNYHIEYGYCVIDEDDEIYQVFIINSEIKLMQLTTNSMINAPVFISPTKDGYFRLWTDNPNIYLMWSINHKEKMIELIQEGVE